MGLVAATMPAWLSNIVFENQWTNRFVQEILQENGKLNILFSTTGAVLAGPGGPSTPGGGASWDLGGGPVCRGAWGGAGVFFCISVGNFPFLLFRWKMVPLYGLKNVCSWPNLLKLSPPTRKTPTVLP